MSTTKRKPWVPPHVRLNQRCLDGRGCFWIDEDGNCDGRQINAGNYRCESYIEQHDREEEARSLAASRERWKLKREQIRRHTKRQAAMNRAYQLCLRIFGVTHDTSTGGEDCEAMEIERDRDQEREQAKIDGHDY